MLKRYGSGIFLLVAITFFFGSIFEKLLIETRDVLLNNYFCSRTDTSYNVSVQYSEDKTEIFDKIKLKELYSYKKFVEILELNYKHRLLDSILEKVKNRTGFNFKIDPKLKICGFYNTNDVFSEAYAFSGEIKDMKLVDILTSSDIGWKTPGDQDEDLVYILIFLFMKGYFSRHHTFVFYTNFIAIYNFKTTGLFRLDINYKKIFDIDLPEDKNVYIGKAFVAKDKITVIYSNDNSKTYDFSEFSSFSNSIARSLKKEHNLEIKQHLYTGDFLKLKNYIDANVLRSDKNFMEKLSKLKTISAVKKLLKKN
ncbi:hypothetical protein NGRA_0158 [Nosema granulosis]|uniref:Uncharacterized protein n=1 Tax=Nosema granulosis TaxID=83296 RepID=A0A9P6KZT7_9MICR|nr:hypothetical protein NGRA_0158 [Nosema granulosis]